MATKTYFQKFSIALFFISMGLIASKTNAILPIHNIMVSQQNAPMVMEWNINGVTRKALVYIPLLAKTKAVPVIFAFHGHGGTMKNMYNTRRFDELWPEAIFICPQGLNTPGKLTDPAGKLAGWEMADKAINKDLLFFDAMLQTLRTDYKINNKKIFATGHSNGGGFTYLLWAARGNAFAAVAPTAAITGKLTSKLKPKPVLHLMGETDPLVKPIWQKQTCNFLLKLNKCNAEGQKIDNYSTLYHSVTGNPVVLFVHPGGHNYPKEANETIIKFFKGIGN